MNSLPQIAVLLIATALCTKGFAPLRTLRCANTSPQQVFSTATTSYCVKKKEKSVANKKQDNIISYFTSTTWDIIYSEKQPFLNAIDRSDFLTKALSSLIPISAATAAVTAEVASAANEDDLNDFQVFKTDSGLKYIEIEQGTSSKTPKYGQVCVISYTGYLQLPDDNTKKKFASQSGFVLKHGNGKLIAGLDEGLHTMKKGGRRRLVIPPKLGFVSGGLGPIPPNPIQRKKLNSLLSQMVEKRGGNLIYDVKLERFFDDEADQGYYNDEEISPEEFAELNRRFNIKSNSGGNDALNAMGDDINLDDRPDNRPIV